MAQDSQLEMTFEADNRLRERLYHDDFTILVEAVRPSEEQPFQLSLLPVADLVQAVAREKRVHGLVLTAGFQAAPERHPILEVIEGIKRERRKTPLAVVVTGYQQDPVRLRELCAGLRSAKVSDLVLVSGFLDKAGDGHPGRYMDSTVMLQDLAEEGMTLAATVNPYKYNIADTFLQYYKLARKINAGAQFIVSEAGWDMKKIQELLWYCQQRNFAVPIVARLRFVRPTEVVPILDGEYPGQVISREFAAQLQREGKAGEKQAEAAQLRRLALQAIGARLLGCSGILLSGIEDPARLAAVLNEIDELSKTLQTYRDWLKAWQDFHDRVEMAPYPTHYYAYKNLLDESIRLYNAQYSRQAHKRLPQSAGLDRLRYIAADMLHLQSRGGSVGRMLRGALCGDPSDAWKLQKTFYIPASQCPKGLEDGACGGSRPDGTCESGDRPCMYHACLARARWLQRLDEFEELPPKAESSTSH